MSNYFGGWFGRPARPQLARDEEASHMPSPPLSDSRHSRLVFDNSMNLCRVPAGGQVRVPLEETFDLSAYDQQQPAPSYEKGAQMSEGEGNGVMGPAGRELGGEMDVDNEDVEDVEDAEGAEDVEEASDDEVVDARMEQYLTAEDADEVQGEQGGAQEDDDVDLFEQVFGKGSQTPADEDDDDVQVIGAAPAGNNGKQRATDYEHDASEHARGCRPKRTVSTPPRDGPPPPKEADLVRDVRKSLQKQRRFHDKAKSYKPNLPLPEHRYWIGVLHIDKLPRNANSEKHFYWMKGNRLTTVQTIWNVYAANNLAADFVIMHGQEKLHFKDKVEELNYFNDNLIILRAVDNSSPDAKGKELGEGCPPEVVEIDID